MSFIHKESIAHCTAKTHLANWLRDSSPDGDYFKYPLRNGGNLSWRPNNSNTVWVEYPFDVEYYGLNPTWDEYDPAEDGYNFGIEWYKGTCPTFEECLMVGRPPVYIVDIALRSKGTIAAVIEVVHKNYPSDKKLEYFRKASVPLYTVNASWILNQIEKPSSLNLRRAS